MKQWICPYCTNEVGGAEQYEGCCGESSAHFVEVDICPNCDEVYFEEDEMDFVPHPCDASQEEMICLTCSEAIQYEVEAVQTGLSDEQEKFLCQK
jgi:hypothetical protein